MGLGPQGTWGMGADRLRAPPGWWPQDPSASERGMTCVCLLVRLEDAGGDEATPAEPALVGLLPGVRPHVLLQVAGLLKALIAIVTPVNTAGRAQTT